MWRKLLILFSNNVLRFPSSYAVDMFWKKSKNGCNNWDVFEEKDQLLFGNLRNRDKKILYKSRNLLCIKNPWSEPSSISYVRSVRYFYPVSVSFAMSVLIVRLSTINRVYRATVWMPR